MCKERGGLPGVVFVVVGLACGCGGGSSPSAGDGGARPDAQPDTPPPFRLNGRIALEPTALLFTKAGAEGQIRARVFDADGKPMERPLTWESSRGASVTVDAQGRVTSNVALGSAQIRARAGDIVSDPVLVLIAEPAPGALLVSDAQIVGQPMFVDRDKALTLGQSQSRVTLTGIEEPKPGTMVLASEGKAVAGKVVSVMAKGGGFEVVLEAVPPLVLFKRLDLDASFLVDQRAVALAELGPPPPTQAPADPKRSKRGDLVAPPPRYDAIAGFECDATFSAALINGEISFKAEPELNANVVLQGDSANGYSAVLIRVEGKVTSTLTGSLTMAPGVAGMATCKRKLTRILIPIGGVVSAIVGLQIPIGATFSIGAAITLSPLELKPEVKGTSSIALGFAYTPQTGVTNLSSVNNTFEPKLEWSGFAADDLPFRIAGGAAVGVTTGLDLGSAVLEQFGGPKPLSILDGFLGAKAEFDLAPTGAQFDAANFASHYKLKLAAELGPGGSAQEALKWLGGPIELKPAITAEKELGRSPFGRIEVDKKSVKVGETLKVKVTLDPMSLSLVGIANVREVRILQLSPGKEKPMVVKTFAGSGGQTDFTHSWTPTALDRGPQFFYAVVESVLAPGLSLEVTEDGERPVTVGDPVWSGMVSFTFMASESMTEPMSSRTMMETGRGQWTFGPGAMPDMHEVTNVSATYTYQDHSEFRSMSTGGQCSRSSVVVNDRNATRTSMDPLAAGRYFTEVDGMWYLPVPLFRGTATGTTSQMVSTTISGPEMVCGASPPPMTTTNPFNQPYQIGAFTLMGTMDPDANAVSGSQSYVAPGFPPRMYQVTYSISR